MSVTAKRADRVVLYNISWQQFKKLLNNLGDYRFFKKEKYQDHSTGVSFARSRPSAFLQAVYMSCFIPFKLDLANFAP